DLYVSDIIKKIKNDIPTCVFGTHVTTCPDEILQNSSVDIVIRGEPEQIIRRLCASDVSDVSAIPGISYRNSTIGQFRHNPPEAWLSPETIPAPAWHYLDLRPYRLPLSGRPFLIVAPIRGCPYRCNFCTAPLYYGSKLRKRPIASVIGEIQNNIARHHIREFFIWADTFTADRRYVQEFCQAILASGMEISWTCNSRVDTIDEQTLDLMKKAGLWMISFGLESGNDAILEKTGKKITVAQSIAAVNMAFKAGIRVAGHFIFGLPDETEQTLEDTLRLSLSMPLDIAQYYTAAPFPGTDLYRDALREGWLPDSSARDTSRLSQGRAALELPGLPSSRVEAFRRYAYRRFYSRPRVLAGLISLMDWGAVRHLRTSMNRFLLNK
ncbi:MAG: B12-binding domain-containing radical SAM protein, partial [Syntrophales bacterium LBB04]|nr:B12-binding domain-containing radical SAM protein [Syntrophales bacterium LBB04]